MAMYENICFCKSAGIQQQINFNEPVLPRTPDLCNSNRRICNNIREIFDESAMVTLNKCNRNTMRVTA